MRRMSLGHGLRPVQEDFTPGIACMGISRYRYRQQAGAGLYQDNDPPVITSH